MNPKETAEPKILAIESSTHVGSVALYAGTSVMGSLTYHKARAHAQLLTPMIQTLMKDLEVPLSALSAVAISRGPGSYTGLRVGTSTAKGLCMALDIPLLSIGSLEALAWQVKPWAQQLGAWICPMIDARRMEVFTSLFDANLHVIRPVAAQVIDAFPFPGTAPDQPIIFVGDGVEKCLTLIQQRPTAIAMPQIEAHACDLGQPLLRKYEENAFEDLAGFEPYYLKDFVATASRKKLLP